MEGEVQALVETLALLTPYEVPAMTRRRYGNPSGDGGYVLLEELLAGQPVVSAGIGQQISFDLALAELGHDIHMFDHTIEAPPSAHPRFRFHRKGIAPRGEEGGDFTSLDAILETLAPGRNDIVLKIDIENHEWAAIERIDEALLRRCALVTLELHGLGQLETSAGRRPRHVALAKLARLFTLFHVHANNHGRTVLVHGMPVPSHLEVSYVRSDLVTRAPNATVYPSAIDPPNTHRRPEVPLCFFPFLPAAGGPAGQRDQVYAAARRIDDAGARAALTNRLIAANTRLREAMAAEERAMPAGEVAAPADRAPHQADA
jgi:hypothetical protein